MRRLAAQHRRRRLLAEPLETRRVLATFLVNTDLDAPDLNPGDGVVDTGVPGQVTLRAAVMEANALPGPDEIDLQSWDVLLTRGGPDFESADDSVGDLDIFDTLAIRNGSVNAGGDTGIQDRVFTVFDRVFEGPLISLALNGVTVSGGRTLGDGGGVLAFGSLTLFQSEFRNNRAELDGGALYLGPSPSQATIGYSSFIDNHAGGAGGAIFSDSSDWTLTTSTLSANTAGLEGGGVADAFGSFEIRSTTIAENSAANGGGVAIIGGESLASLSENIIALNEATASNPDMLGDFMQLGPNLIGDVGTSTGLSGPLVGGGGNPLIDPLLGALGLNGGLTPSYRLQAQSLAVDAGSAQEDLDQNGLSRPLDGRGDGVLARDLGSAELNQILIDNDIPVGQVGSFFFEGVPGGASGLEDLPFAGIPVGSTPIVVEAINGRITAAGRQSIVDDSALFNYAHYVQVDGSVFNLSQTLIDTQALAGDDLIISRGEFIGDRGPVRWEMRSQMADNLPLLQNTITFFSDNGLGPIRLINYLDQQVQATNNDLLYVTGASADDDLRLFTLDNQQRVGFSQFGAFQEDGERLSDATFDGWSADAYVDLLDSLKSGSATFSPMGVVNTTNLTPMNDPDLGLIYGLADVTTALAWSVDPNSSSAILTTYLSLVIDGSSQLSGAKYSDLNANRMRDPLEPGLPGVTILLDVNDDGEVDRSTLTGLDGSYVFEDVPPGVHRVSEVVPAGYRQTAPLDSTYLVDLHYGGDISGLDFGNEPILIDISGTKFNDLNQNGVIEADEPGLGGFTIELDLDDDGNVDQSTITAEDGSYVFMNVPPGDHRVHEVATFNWRQTYPIAGDYLISSVGFDITELDFANTRGFATGAFVSDVASADLNNDERPDIIVVNDRDFRTPASNRSSLSLFFADDNGRFGPEVQIPLPGGSRPQAVVSGDFDGNGFIDLAVAAIGDYANRLSGRVWILHNDGAGGFLAPRPILAGDGPIDLTVGDFNGDAILDLVAANYRSNGVSLLLGDGLGGFAPRAEVFVGAGPLKVATGDFNNDGQDDIITALYTSGQVQLLTGGPNGLTLNHVWDGFSQPSDLAVARLDPRSTPLFAVADRGNQQVAVLSQDALGGWTETRVAAPSAPSTVAFGDLDGDGRQELIVGDDQRSAITIYSSLNGSWSADQSIELPELEVGDRAAGASARALWVGSINDRFGDDILIGHFIGGASLQDMYAGGALRLETALARPLHHFAFPLDANHDGRVGASDVLLVAQHIYRGEALKPNAHANYSPDTNGDGAVTPLDALNILQAMLGRRSVEPRASTAALPSELDPALLAPLAEHARTIWVQAAGQGVERRLRAIQWEIVDLPGDQLANVRGNTIRLDRDAAGRGWFVSFSAADPAGHTSGLRDSQRVDLLTVVLHEMGHLLGLDDQASATPQRLMYPWLDVGQRRLPTEAEIDRVLAGQ